MSVSENVEPVSRHCYFMATAYADFNNEACLEGLPADRCLALEIPIDFFYGNAWNTIIPLPRNIAIVNAVLFIIDCMVTIAVAPIIIEELHAPPDPCNEDGAVIGYRFWICLDEMCTPEFTGSVNDRLGERTQTRQVVKRVKLDSVPEQPKLISEVNVREKGDLAKALQYMYPNIPVTGALDEFEITGLGPMSLVTLLSADGVYSGSLNHRLTHGAINEVQADVTRYWDEDTRHFKVPGDFVKRGWVRKFPWKSADEMLSYTLPYVEAPEKLVRERLRAMDPNHTDNTNYPLWAIIPCSYPVPEDSAAIDYDGQKFSTPLQRYEPIPVPQDSSDDHSQRIMSKQKPMYFHIHNDNLSQFAAMAAKARTADTKSEKYGMVLASCKRAAGYYERMNHKGSEIPKYHQQYRNAEKLLENMARAATEVDAKARNIFYSEFDPDYTTISGMLKQINDLAGTLLSLKAHQLDAFMISFLLSVCVMKNAIGPQSFVMLLGPPEAGKSFTLDRVVEMFSSEMIQTIDQESRQAATYAMDNDTDMTITVLDEGLPGITRPGGKQDQLKAIEKQKEISSGFFVKRVVQRNPENGQIEVMTIEIMRRQVNLAASNYLVQSAALASRLLKIHMSLPKSKSDAAGSATSAAIFNTEESKKQRKPMITAMNTLTSCAGIIYGLLAAGAATLNYSNSAILRVLNQKLKMGLETGARVGAYIDKIAESIHILNLASQWWRQRKGAKFQYKLEFLILFLRCNCVVPVEAYSIASKLTYRVTHVVKELFAVACAIKMCVQTPVDGDTKLARIQRNSSNSHFLLTVKLSELRNRIYPLCKDEGEGPVQSVLTELQERSVESGIMMLETCTDDPSAKNPVAMIHPSLFKLTGALTDAEKTLLKILAAVIRNPDKQRWWPHYDPDPERNVMGSPIKYVFKPAVVNAILDTPTPKPAPNIFYPEELQRMGFTEHAAAIAFLDYKNQMSESSDEDTWMSVPSAKIAEFSDAVEGDPGNSGTYGVNVKSLTKTSRLLIVSAKLIESAEKGAVDPNNIQCAGMRYSGKSAPGKKIYKGATTQTDVVPPLATAPEKIPNATFVEESIHKIYSTAPAPDLDADMLGDLEEFMPPPPQVEVVEVLDVEEDDTYGFFSPHLREISLQPGYETTLQDEVFRRENGCDRPVVPPWEK